ncbi:unnamed protein product [Ambrosiozyma monospora]|uniref:Unnamed protein product n=1 Tax=Ambrosiozyma monospora TaxID=43982 RepID=A0ACB5TV24_AMBMO|nr:unnamed protein product [Ambrosiozyma monospora]
MATVEHISQSWSNSATHSFITEESDSYPSSSLDGAVSSVGTSGDTSSRETSDISGKSSKPLGKDCGISGNGSSSFSEAFAVPEEDSSILTTSGTPGNLLLSC